MRGVSSFRIAWCIGHLAVSYRQPNTANTKKSCPSLCDLRVGRRRETAKKLPVEIMSSKAIVKTTFGASRTLRPIYTGGSTALDASGRILLSCVGEDALIVSLETGDQLASLEGVSRTFLLPF